MKVLLLCLILFATMNLADAEAQTLPEPRQSPVGITRVMLGDTYIKVVYGRPQMRGREIFGALVPHGEVWRTGANEATEITLTGDITIGGHALEAGTYSMFSIPGTSEWTLIISKQLGQWGSYNYNARYDKLRFTVPVSETTNPVDFFTILLEAADDRNATMTIEWEKTRLTVPIAKK